MCGRYYIEISDAALKELIEEINLKMAGLALPEQLQLKLDGEVFPTDVVAAQDASGGWQPMRWGFSGFQGPRGGKSARPIINARSETVLEKPTFRKPALEQRCLIPASGYYEWRRTGSKRTKYRLYSPGQPIFLAACYRLESSIDQGYELPRFVILTQAAAPGIADIHDRMPVAFTAVNAQAWLTDGTSSIASSLQDLSFEVD
jgi:putative SOS response-associated peptidase YedK